MPDEMFALRRDGRRARAPGDRRRSRRGGAPAGHARCEDDGARAGCAGRVTPPVGSGLVVFDRADARRCSRGDIRDRRGGGHECSACSPWHCSPRRCGLGHCPRRVPGGAAPGCSFVAASTLMTCSAIVPPATLGILGGGQLGRYAVMAAASMGYRTMVLDPDPSAPAGLLAHEHLVAAYDDPEALVVSGSTVTRSPPSSRTRPLPRSTSSRRAWWWHRRQRRYESHRTGSPRRRSSSTTAFPSAGSKCSTATTRRSMPRWSTSARSSRPLGSATTARVNEQSSASPTPSLPGPNWAVSLAWSNSASTLDTELSVIVGRAVVGRRRSVAGRGEHPRRRHSRPDGRAGGRVGRTRRSSGRPGDGGGRRPRLRRRACRRDVRRRTANCSSTNSHRARTTAGTGRSTPASPASTSSRCVRCAGSGWGRPAMTAPAIAMVNLLGDLWEGGDPDWASCSTTRTPSCICTARRRRDRAGRWATSP